MFEDFIPSIKAKVLPPPLTDFEMVISTTHRPKPVRRIFCLSVKRKKHVRRSAQSCYRHQAKVALKHQDFDSHIVLGMIKTKF